MFKIITLTFCVAAFTHGSILKIKSDNLLKKDVELLKPEDKWMKHFLDFIELIDLEKTIGVAIEYIADPEVLRFVNFLLSKDFKEVVADFESLEEFKEAFNYLSNKGYDVKSVIDSINSFLDLPSFQIPPRINKAQKGMTGFIEAIFATLPIDKIKELFQEKIDNNAEVKELYVTLNSDEFKNILERMKKNPKFLEIKAIFEQYGFDFEYLIQLIKEVFGF